MKILIHYLERVGSTNSYAFGLCKKNNSKEGDVYVAHEQFNGRGYHENIWESEPGKNLTFSLVLQPGFIKPGQQFVITQCISLAISYMLNDLLPNETIRIKWPNDIYINEKKVCGILVQNIIVGNKFEYAIVGIGLNVNQKKFPDELPNPISIIDFFEKELNLEAVLTELLSFIDKKYAQLMVSTSAFTEKYLNQLYRFNQKTPFKDANSKFVGSIKGIGEFGELLIEDEKGCFRKYSFKEIEMLI